MKTMNTADTYENKPQVPNEIPDPAALLTELGIDGSRLRTAVTEVWASSETLLQTVAEYIIFRRLVVNLCNQSANEMNERALLENALPNERQRLQESINGLKRYTEIINRIQPYNTAGMSEVVRGFVRTFQTGIISCTDMRGDESSFSVALLFRIYPSSKNHVEEVINTIGAWIENPYLIPEYSFIVSTLVDKVRKLYNSPVMNEACKEGFMNGLVGTLKGPTQSRGADCESVTRVIDLVGNTFDVIVDTYNNPSIDRNIVIKSLLLMLSPVIKTISSMSSGDAVIWDLYKDLMSGNITDIPTSQWVEYKNRLCLESPICFRLYQKVGSHINTLLDFHKLQAFVD